MPDVRWLALIDPMPIVDGCCWLRLHRGGSEAVALETGSGPVKGRVMPSTSKESVRTSLTMIRRVCWPVHDIHFDLSASYFLTTSEASESRTVLEFAKPFPRVNVVAFQATCPVRASKRLTSKLARGFETV